jgi:hypothetical protein
MSSAPTAEEIWRDATWLAQALDPSAGLARLIAMDREAYRAASFLDDRMLQQPVDAQIVPWPPIEEAMSSDPRQDARWIFHIGHVGSTLVSRLLGEIEGVLAIREPRLLRDLAISPPEVRGRYIASVPKLLSRTFAAEEIACVKATSVVSEIAPELVPPGERTLFMFARPRSYVASILAGENSVKELRVLENYRLQRLASRGISLPPARNDAERAAAAWTCEMTSLEAAAGTMMDREILWADFDAMLSSMRAELLRTANFFGFASDAERLSAIAAGPLMSRYSKALEYEYSPSLREELIADANRLHGREIDLALVMLRSAAEKHELIARALSRAEGRA